MILCIYLYSIAKVEIAFKRLEKALLSSLDFILLFQIIENW